MSVRMSILIEGKEYLNTREVLEELATSKALFYANVKPYLRVYRFGAKKTPWYRKDDVIAFKLGKPVRKASIAISGILGDWTLYLQSLGYQAETITRMVEVTPLPEDAMQAFRLPAEMARQTFVRRSRMTYADGVPICTWDTYYPVDLVSGILDDMLRGEARNIVEYIKEMHGLTIGVAKDKYMARITTLDELNLFQLPTDEPVLVLQRVSYTQDKRTLILYSNMALLGSWFAPEHEYSVQAWNDQQAS